MYKISDYPQIQGNFFLSGRNAGASKKLLGNVDLLTVLLKRSRDDWSAQTQNGYYAAVKEAAELIMKEAARYGASLRIRSFHLETTVSPTASPKDGCALVKDYFHKDTVAELQEHYKKTMKADAIPVILAFNEAGRSFAFKKNTAESFDTQEISVLFFKDGGDPTDTRHTIAHELLHQFGAIDYYFPEEVKRTAQKYIGDSIMGIGKPVVDDLTAYLIGWKDTVSANSYWFLKETMWVNAEKFNEAKTKQWTP